MPLAQSPYFGYFNILLTFNKHNPKISILKPRIQIKTRRKISVQKFLLIIPFLNKQTNSVSMGSASGTVLANMILSDFGKLIVSDLIASGIIKFYRRYVDDTLVLIRPSDISHVLNKFNNFDKNLKFTVDTFSDGIIHFSGILISENNRHFYQKPTH